MARLGSFEKLTERITWGIRGDRFLFTDSRLQVETLTGDIAMALEANGQRFCKVVHTENQRTTIRRIHTMMVQAADGRLHHLSGRELPDEISLYTGAPYRGAHMAEVLLSPKKAHGIPMLSNGPSWIGKRDAFFLVFGMFAFWLVATLAEQSAQALSGL